MMTAPLATTSTDLVVAMFVDTNHFGEIAAGSGWSQRGSDTTFYSIVVDGLPPGAEPR